MDDIHAILRGYALSQKKFVEKFNEIRMMHNGELLTAFLAYELWSLKKILH